MTNHPLDDVETMAAHSESADHKGYLEAVVSAGQRSRAIVYFVLILLVLTGTTMRNSYSPDWMAVRAEAYQDMLRCLKVHDVAHPDCRALVTRVGRAGFATTNNELAKSIGKIAPEIKIRGDFSDSNFEELNKLVIDEVELKMKKFFEKDIETYIIKIPLLGSTVDINDLWLVSGVVMFFLLYFLKASLVQERLNIKYIIDNKPELGKLIVLNQVVTVSAHTNPVVKVFQLCVALAPTFLYLYLFYMDATTREIGYFLLDGWYFNDGQTWVEAATIALVVYMNFGCLYHYLRVQEMISALREKL